MSSIATQVNLYEGYFHAITARFDQLEHKLENLIDKVIDVVKDSNELKDLPLDKILLYVLSIKGIR